MKKTITILEDDEDIRDIYTYFFECEGFGVKAYGTVADFSRELGPTDLFLLDVRLPDGNGIDVCGMLRGDGRYCKIPIIIMSAHINPKVPKDNFGADCFIEKPFDLDNLLRQVELLTR
jgi:DNA-binding response OmpR family regulator